MKISWIGHSCFKLEEKDYSIILDPYADGYVPGYTDIRESAQEVLCSHEHRDHNAREVVKLLPVPASRSPFTIEYIDTFHDEVKGAKRGENRINILTAGELRISHLGDLGCDLEEEQLEKLKNLDLLLIPVGGFYTIDGEEASQLVSKLKPRLVIPMHFRDDEKHFGYDVISTVRVFTDSLGKEVPVEFREESELSLSKEKDEGTKVVVLSPKNLA